MEYVKLKEVCAINMGQSPDSDSYNDNGKGVPFFQGNADFGERYPVTRKWCTAPTKMAKPEDILISVRAPIGAMNYAKEDCCIGRGLAALTPDKTKVSHEFIFWLLKGKNTELNSKGIGSTFKAIGRKVLEETMVPDIPLEKQIEYSAILENVYLVIQMRKEELQQLDELIKARFVEMFGDTSKFKTEPLSNNVEEMFIGPFGSALKNKYFVDEENAYCMVYEQKHAIQKTMEVPTRYVDENKYNELKRFSVYGGDIIVSCRGTIGEIFSVPEGAPLGVMHPSIMKIRLKKDKYCNQFFVYMLEQYMQDSTSRAKGSGVKMAITATELGKELFVVPEIDEQIAFEQFVKQVDKSKFIA